MWYQQIKNAVLRSNNASQYGIFSSAFTLLPPATVSETES